MRHKSTLILSLILTVILTFGIFEGCNDMSNMNNVNNSVTASPVNLEKDAKYYAEALPYATFEAADTEHHIVQGGYFDGNYFYVAFIKDDNPESGVIIEKLDLCGNVVKKSEPLALDHANNITFNKNKNVLVVTHCQSNAEDRYSHYSFVDIDTLELLETGKLDHPFYAIAYSEERNMYASGEWAGGTLDTWDGELKHLMSKDTKVHTYSTSQGCFADGNYIYFVRSGNNNTTPEIVIFDWELNELYNIFIDNITVEPESINFVNGTAFVICNNASVNGGEIYTIEVKKA